MKLILITLISLVLFCSCSFNPTAFKDCKERPLTIREKGFLKQLEKDSILNPVLYRFDYNYRPGYPYVCENQNGVYGVSSYNTSIDMYEDSIKLDAYLKELILNMYSGLMNDSIKYYTPCVQIDFSTWHPSKKFPKGTSIHATALKKDIESYFGRKLVSGKQHLEWKTIPKVKELKICMSDSCADKWW